LLIDGPGYDFNGLVFIGDESDGPALFIRRRDDDDENVQKIPLADLLWLIQTDDSRREQTKLKEKIESLLDPRKFPGHVERRSVWDRIMDDE
jgi:hypothetical protein